MRIAFATMEKFDNRPFNSVGSSRIRARWLINHWPGSEEFMIGREYDVLVFQKVYWMDMVKSFEGIKILDICDPDWLEGKPVMEYAGLCDAVVTSSEPLAEYMRKFLPGKRMLCIPDRIELSEYPLVKKEHASELKKVVHFGYSQNFHYVEMALDALIRRGIELTVIADKPMTPPAGYPGLTIGNIKYVQETLAQDIAPFDAVLLPDPAAIDERGKYKSNNKVVQAWALGMPVARVEADLDRLASKEAREKESAEKRKEVEEKWDVGQSAREYQELILEIADARKGGINVSGEGIE